MLLVAETRFNRAGNVCEVEGLERLSLHFFPCNAIGLMLNFANVGEAGARSVPALPGQLPPIDWLCLHLRSYITTVRGLSQKFQDWCHKTIIWNANHKLQVLPFDAVLPERDTILCSSLYR